MSTACLYTDSLYFNPERILFSNHEKEDYIKIRVVIEVGLPTNVLLTENKWYKVKNYSQLFSEEKTDFLNKLETSLRKKINDLDLNTNDTFTREVFDNMFVTILEEVVNDYIGKLDINSFSEFNASVVKISNRYMGGVISLSYTYKLKGVEILPIPTTLSNCGAGQVGVVEIERNKYMFQMCHELYHVKLTKISNNLCDELIKTFKEK